jgi:hypothetical protein
MKRVLLTAVAVFGFAFANAQDATIKAGVHVGMPMGDIKDFSTLNVGADFAYLWEVADNFKAGFATGITAYLPKEQEFTYLSGINFTTFQPVYTTEKVKGDTALFLPVTGSAEYSFTENIFVGADLGYAVGLAPDGVEGGLLYQPKLGYQTEKIALTLGYKAISQEGGAYSSVNLGFGYKF